MANVGYVRVSSVDQKLSRQLDGIQLDKTFEDKVSGGTKDRLGLTALLDYVRDGDMVHVHSIDRLARNLEDLLSLLRRLNETGVSIKFYKENLTFTGEDNPFQSLQLQIIGAVAQFERSMIRERQREGIAKARQDKSKYRGRRPTIDPVQVKSMNIGGKSPTTISKELGIARSSVYRLLEL
ncbi:MAG: recombinase family protein [Methylocystaceae bacterium]|nr:recombinase family protein [Methylocystaceae bacterium]